MKRRSNAVVKLSKFDRPVRGDDGKIIKLSSLERKRCEIFTKFANNLGYDIPITTLTSIMKKISMQKFFQIPFADYLPVRVGEGAWSDTLLTYRSFFMSGDFENGIINTGGNSSRLASADAGVDSVPIKVFNWANEVTWTIFDIQQAAKAGNWDIVTSKEKARKMSWDLGLQRIAFLGARGQNASAGACVGLLNLPGILPNTTLITKAISSMDPAELKVFTAGLLQFYRQQSEYTAWPDRFIIPESDFNGLVSTASATFPIRSTLNLLLEAFRENTMNPNFKILPLAYADASQHADVAAIAGKQRYVLLNANEETVRMDIPVDYTNTLANSLNNFSMQNVGYGQFTGVGLYRQKEVAYFDYPAS